MRSLHRVAGFTGQELLEAGFSALDLVRGLGPANASAGFMAAPARLVARYLPHASFKP